MQLQGSAAMMVQSQSLRACGASACVSASLLVGLALRLLAAVLGSQFRSEWLSASLASLTRPLSLALFWHASMYAPTRPRQGSSIFFSVLFSSNCVLSSILFRCVVHELHVVRSRLLFGIVRSHLCLISCALLWRKLDGIQSHILHCKLLLSITGSPECSLFAFRCKSSAMRILIRVFVSVLKRKPSLLSLSVLGSPAFQLLLLFSGDTFPLLPLSLLSRNLLLLRILQVLLGDVLDSLFHILGCPPYNKLLSLSGLIDAFLDDCHDMIEPSS
jgi:hypothetical protein